ncbi:PadR family transcriptional regulator [Inquilinus sp. Marseille-Q2685]|uniref:PadR family transcriptional regulator n=1 Tax=Inquilinus sp. Marseille-Q2685 TaxID=2866581 RepID=UPI001CE3C886|nr:PadR family transcriptional regulator [Inquilinus sp. Marseille-Q2685]
MSKPAKPLEVVPRQAPEYTSRSYWSGTIKMSLSKFFILRVLHDRPMHGYDIARAVELTTNGCCSPTEGTIYPVLRDFEEGGYVTSETELVCGRQRKTYTLTDKGRDAFRVGVEAWMEVTAALVETGTLVERAGKGGCCT